MCYKTEEHLKIENKLNNEIKECPGFVKDYLMSFKSSRTKKVNLGIVIDLLNYALAEKIIDTKALVEISYEDMQKFTSSDIVRYLNNKHIEGNSLATINMKKAVLGGFWTFLFNNDIVGKNVVHLIDKNLYKPEESNVEKIVKIPTENQLKEFFSNIAKSAQSRTEYSRNMAIINLFLGSGIRCEELIGLDVEDINIDDINPFVMVMGKGKLYKKDKVYITTSAVNSLKAYLNYRNSNTETALFVSRMGNRISKGALTNIFTKNSDGKINPHMLRHLYGTRLYNATKNIVFVQKQLRHSSIETAAKYYIHTSEFDLCNAVKNL